MTTELRGRRVLVADDDAEMCAGIVEVLTDAGLDVASCPNGREALARLRTGIGSDLVVLDLHMPVMDGWEFRAAQKRDPLLARTPVLVLSGDDGPQARAIDAELVLKKPFDAHELLNAVSAVLLAPAERSARARADARAQRLASLGTLAAGMAHEINNPLACIMGRLDLARMAGGRVDPKSLDDLTEAARRIRDIVRDIQTFASVEDVEAEPADVRRVLEASLRMVSHEVRHRARVVTDFRASPLVHANPSRLGQVFVNLLVNAGHAIVEGNADANEIRITLDVDDGGWTLVTISDTGCGMEPSVVVRVFDPFFTTKPVGSGMGLGLSICHGIVTGAGGTIDVESEVGRGSSFRVRLPPARWTAPRSSRPKPAPERAPVRRRLLVVEDEPALVRMIAAALGDNHEVVSVGTGREALATLERDERFDAVLCDLMMPEMTGMDLYAELRRRRPGVEKKLVFMTGGAFTPRSMEFLGSVTNARLSKPFGVRELQDAIASILASPLMDR